VEIAAGDPQNPTNYTTSSEKAIFNYFGEFGGIAAIF
jgi:hypothetical protein